MPYDKKKGQWVGQWFTLTVNYKGRDYSGASVPCDTKKEAYERYANHKAEMEVAGKPIKEARIIEHNEGKEDRVVFQYPTPKIKYEQLDLFLSLAVEPRKEKKPCLNT